MGKLSQLGKALDQESYQYLIDNYPSELSESLEDAVEEGATPLDIRRFVMQNYERRELALRCEQAARWLVDNG